MPQDELFRQLNALRKQGQLDEALAVLRDALRRGRLGPEEVERAGRFIEKAFDLGASSAQKALRATLLGQCTTSWLVPALTATAWGRGGAVRVSEGGYDNVLQDLLALQGAAERPDVIVLVPWNQRLVGRREPSAQVIENEISFWRQAWSLVNAGLGARLVQVGYDWVMPGALGHHVGGRAGGMIHLIRELNSALQAALPDAAYFLDLEAVSGALGRESFYDLRRYYWTKQPFSEAGTLRLSEHLWAGIRALTTGPKKVLVLDLDNTLWGGVVGETGPLGIGLGESPEGEAFRSLQAHAKELSARGVILAVASKNNPADAREPFGAHPEMVLKLDDFGAFEACWEPKGQTIARIAETLNLGLDSFVFLDDNPAEREQVRQALPDVEVVEVSEDPAEFLRTLQSGLWFETVAVTDADRERSQQYVVEQKRRDLQQEFGSLDDYLRSLEMTADVRAVDDGDLQRVVQLIAKTNQFNLTTRRHTRDDVAGMIAHPRAIPLTIRVRDKFGDYGLVVVMIGIPAPDETALVIDTWLMSCRVIGRTVEEFSLQELLTRAQQLGYERVVGEFIPSKKNALVAGLYDRMGFSRLNGVSHEDGIVRYELSVDRAQPPRTFVVGNPRAIRECGSPTA